MKAILKSLYQNSRNKKILKLIFDAFNKDYYIREAVAQNQRTPISILEKLSNDKKSFVRVSVARNPNTPDYILEKLSNDESKYVRSFVAKNPITPIHILEKLSNDINENMFLLML